MNNFEATLVIAGLLVIRIALPLLITLGFGVAMNRMTDRWQAGI